MKIAFDPAKDAANFAKHGVSLALAKDIEWESAVIWPDTRHDYGEARQACIGYVGDRLFHVVFTYRGTSCRIISLRKANQREIRRYAET